MRSEMQGRAGEQAQVPVRDRIGEVLAASLSVQFVESVIGVIALFVWQATQEGPSAPINPMGVFLLIFLAPFGAAFAALLTYALVIPLLTGAARLGRRFSGREAGWWVPALAAAGTAPAALAVTVLAEAGPVAGLCGWVTAAVALAVPALAARRVLLPHRPRLSVRAVFGWVALYGTLAAVTAFTLAGIALYAGIGYEPPQLNKERMAGTWSDGRGGTLTLAADGRVTATRIETSDFDDSFETVLKKCSGDGTWEYDPGSGPWSQSVTVSVADCLMDEWRVTGSDERPKLFVTVGDPDDGNFYILRRRD
ncbi:hypothetical protein OG259_18200 [Streptomyces sp. NBC_00250]|uniref:hypothetical protein n=1 Tax=Streptomyces sp. NBC_00250 TaxID=2903641 RepID=UPI002E2DD8DD|nr:hypothetical protein [Streptomyces sp. NBC_00250]